MRERLGPANVILDEQAVPGITKDSLTVVLERCVLASTQIVHRNSLVILFIFHLLSFLNQNTELQGFWGFGVLGFWGFNSFAFI